MAGGEQGTEIAWDVFLAHASPDKDRVEVLYEALVATGLKVCFDERSLLPGDVWPKLLPKNLASSAVIVITVSDASADAHYETEEIVQAIELYRSRGVRLIPVWLDEGATPPYGLRSFNKIDHFDDAGTAAVADAIAEMVALERSAHERRASTGLSRPIFSSQIPPLPIHFADPYDLVDQLWEAAEAGGTKVLTQSISGLGGVGKTTAAAALCERARGRLDVVWWVRAEDQNTLVADLAALAQELEVADATDVEAAARAAVRALSETELRWLLVFDNALDEPTVNVWRPRSGNGMVLVTSRNRNMNRLGDVISLAVWPDAVADQFLRERVVGRNPRAATGSTEAILQRLGGLPLAIEQAAAWVERIRSHTFDRYVEMFDQAMADAFPDETAPLDYEHTAMTTWRVSIAAANAEAPGAEQVMEVVCQFAPSGLPTQWITAAAEIDDGHLSALTPDQVDDALGALDGYSLLTITEEDTIEVHRLVSAAVRTDAPAEALLLAVHILRLLSPDSPLDYRSWPILTVIAPHLSALVARASSIDSNGIGELWWVLDDIAQAETARGNVQAAIAHAEAAAALALERFGPEGPNHLTSQGTLAGAYSAAGNLTKAIPLFETVYQDRIRVSGEDHHNTVTSAGQLAAAYLAAGDVERALPLLDLVKEQRERLNGPEDSATLIAANNLAVAYQTAKQLDRAIEMFEQLYEVRLRVSGPHHVETLTCANNLALAYDEAGQPERALPLYESNFARTLELLGPDHRNTFAAQNNLASAYLHVGQTDRAIELLEANDRDRTAVLGPDHPDTITGLNNLANAYSQAERFDEAIELFEQVTERCNTVLGPTHPYTLVTTANLAGEVARSGQIDRAIQLFTVVRSGQLRVLAPDHPDVSAVAYALARGLDITDRLDEAIALYESVVETLARTVGTGHDDTRAAVAHLADAYRRDGREADAAALESRFSDDPEENPPDQG